MYQICRWWSYFICFLRKATDGNFLSCLQGLPFTFTKHLYSVSFSNAFCPSRSEKKISPYTLSGMTYFLMLANGWNSGMIIICLQAVFMLKMKYFANRTWIILADNSHFVDASVTDGFVVALSNSDELGFLCAKDTLFFCHFFMV